MNCETIRDVYPDVLNGTAEPVLVQQVRAHVASCDECRGEIALIDSIHGAQTPVPAALHERVVRAASAPQPRWRVSRGGLAMAATLAAAVIGGSLLLESQNTASQQEAEEGFGFVSVEGAMMSGTTSLNDLSVEELEKLLGEMES
jgi:hypothetical protein